jgi:hypothetical protein
VSKGQLVRLSLENIKLLDGGLPMEMFQESLRRAVKDCLDRPGDKRTRKITLQVNLTPVAEVRGNTIDCDGAKGIFLCKTKLPDYESREVDFGVQNSGELLFNPDSPSNHKQMTMLEDPE